MSGVGPDVVALPHASKRRFPEPLASAWTQIPCALMEKKHREALGIGPNELLVIQALEMHRREMGDEVFPSQKLLTDHTGLSISKVRRAVERMVRNGLITRRQPGCLQGKGDRANTRYNLDPLWERLADLVRTSTQRGTTAEGLGTHHRSPTEPLGEHQHAPSIPAEPLGTQNGGDLVRKTGGTWYAPATPEVDVVEVDAFEVDEEARPRATLSEKELSDLFEEWINRCRGGSKAVYLTEQRITAARSRRSRDGFTFDECREAINGAAQAIEREELDYEHQWTEFARIFIDREHTQAWIKYSRTGDYEVLQEVYLNEQPRVAA